MKKLTITSYSIEKIEALIRSKEDYKIALRLLCILQIAKGGSSHKAEELMYLSHNQICQWVNRFNKDGLDGLKDKPRSGRKPRLTLNQLAYFRDIVINKSPEDFGYNTSIWTAPLLIEWAKKELNVKYSDDAIYFILKKKLGLRHKKGKGYFMESDSNQRSQFVDTLKKTS